MDKWVRHISGQGTKWEVKLEEINEWEVKAVINGVKSGIHWLPKSEYILCEPPERWEDVTDQCNIYDGKIYHAFTKVIHCGNWDNWKVSKIEVNRVGPGIPHGCKKQWAFIVERKIQP